VDTIADFEAFGQFGEVIELNGYGISSFQTLQSQMVQSGADVVITLDAANQIILQNVNLEFLKEDDFLLL
jgi:hypothetical protein